jgi:CubicO group peptidase (beta-lactamase class C family)
MSVAAAGLGISLNLALSAAVAAPANRPPDVAAIDRYVESEMDEQRIPGLALGIVHGDRILHVQGFGTANRSGQQVTAQTPFFIGSVTKSFTALASPAHHRAHLQPHRPRDPRLHHPPPQRR